jgi:outer membrane protein assembly factor BamB
VKTSTRIGLRLACPLALLAACGGAPRTAAFSPDWQSDDGASITAVVTRLGDAKVPEGKGLAVGVTRKGLVAIGLDGSGKWTRPGPVDSRPTVAGDVVVFLSGPSVVAVDGRTGRDLWKVAAPGKELRGAGDDGTQTVVSLAAGGKGSEVLVVGRGGSVVRKWEPGSVVGVPAIARGIVFAPWGNQYVSALDVDDGTELGRVLGRVVMNRAQAMGGALYFGQSAFLRFDADISKAASNGANRVTLPERELPGKPVWFPDGSRPLPPHATAADSIRFYARPSGAGAKLGIDGERYAATYFQVVVGFHSDGGTLRWVRNLPAEIIGGDAVKGGFAHCDVKGDVWLTDGRAGGASGKVSLGEAVEACVVSGGSFQVKPGEDAGALIEQISATILLRNTQMATIQRFLLRELGTSEDPGVTKTLLELASDARTEPGLLEEARNLLASRTTGVDLMLEALGRHYDYLSDIVRTPPVGPLSDALAAAGDKRAAPLLARHLNDPADTPNDVKRAARALVKLGGPDELDEVTSFFALYRATADNDDLVSAVVDSARRIVQFGGDAGKELIQRAASDPLTHPQVKAGLETLVPKAG